VPKVKKKRMGFVIDMTPLVDITFLLLTFLMFTAKFKSEAEADQEFMIVRPAASPDTTNLPERDLAIISVALENNDQDTTYYFGMTNSPDREKVFANIPQIPDSLKMKGTIKADSLLLNSLIRNTRIVNPSTIFALDADRDVEYRFVFNVMDMLRKNRIFTFNYVTEKRKGQESPEKTE
jgi:biopolymer transport protein ExbD